MTQDEKSADDIADRMQEMGEHWIANGPDCIRAAGEIRRLRAQSDEDCRLQDELIKAERAIERLRAEVEQLKRGEYICRKCGLRKDSEPLVRGDF